MTRHQQLLSLADRLVDSGVVSGFAVEEDAPEGYFLLSGILTAHPEVLVSLVDDGEDADEDAGEDAALAPLDADWLAARLLAAPEHLAVAAEVVSEPGDDLDWASWGPELAFFGGEDWSIRFAAAPMGGELGVLVTLTGTEITGAQTLDEDEGDEEDGDSEDDDRS